MMSRKQRFISLPLAGTIFFCLLVGVYLLVWKRFSKSDPSDTVKKRSVETSPEDALTYWTTDKMRNARAVPLPEVNALRRGKRNLRRSPRSPRPPQD